MAAPGADRGVRCEHGYVRAQATRCLRFRTGGHADAGGAGRSGPVRVRPALPLGECCPDPARRPRRGGPVERRPAQARPVTLGEPAAVEAWPEEIATRAEAALRKVLAEGEPLAEPGYPAVPAAGSPVRRHPAADAPAGPRRAATDAAHRRPAGTRRRSPRRRQRRRRRHVAAAGAMRTRASEAAAPASRPCPAAPPGSRCATRPGRSSASA